MADSILYEKRYGATYHSLDHKKNRFIFLDGNIDHWNISGDQLEFLIEALSDIHNINNIFIFSHQVLWWTWDNKYKELELNSHDGFVKFPNYWDKIHPKLDSLDLPVYVFAGDVGAANWSSDFMYDKLDNVHLIASGMGEDNGDNFIEVKVNNNNVQINLQFLPDNHGGGGLHVTRFIYNQVSIT